MMVNIPSPDSNRTTSEPLPPITSDLRPKTADPALIEATPLPSADHTSTGEGAGGNPSYEELILDFWAAAAPWWTI